MISRKFTKSAPLFFAAAAALALSGCMQTGGMASGDMGEMDPLTAQLSGKTLTNENGTIVLGADGSMSGAIPAGEVAGAWTVRNGQYCRTLTAPARFAGTLCQEVRFNDDTVTFVGGVSGDSTYTMS
jgi:hypothetical protein